MLTALLDRCPGARGVGYDVSAHALAAARAHAAPGVEFRHGDAFAAPERFDIALAIDVFEHVEDYLGFLRALRPMARIHVFHIPLDMTVQAVRREEPLLRARRELGHLHSFSEGTALATLEHAGYAVEDWSHTFASTERPAALQKRPGMKRLALWPRRVMQAIDPAAAARWLGGGSLLVLARGRP